MKARAMDTNKLHAKEDKQDLGTKDVEPRREKRSLLLCGSRRSLQKEFSHTTALISSVKKNANAIAPLAKRKKHLPPLDQNDHWSVKSSEASMKLSIWDN